MVTLDQVEKLRKRANISYDEAKEALEEANGDILEAVISLEKRGRIKTPKGGGYYSSQKAEGSKEKEKSDTNMKNSQKDRGISFGELLRKFVKWCGKIIKKGNRNHFEAFRDEEKIISIPVTVLVILLFIGFWLIIPLIIAGLFFGYRYAFNGPDLGIKNVNRAMDSVADAAERFKQEVKGEDSDGEDSNS